MDEDGLKWFKSLMCQVVILEKDHNWGYRRNKKSRYLIMMHKGPIYNLFVAISVVAKSSCDVP